MMAEPIFMRIGESREVELADLSAAIVNFLGLLRDVDSTISNRRYGYLKWRVSLLSDNPHPLIGVTPFVPKRDFQDISHQVEREVVANLSSLTENGERNRYLSDAALGKVERIARTTPKIGESKIYTSDRGDFRLQTSVSVKTLHQIQELTNVQSVSFGTVIGSLDSISVHKGQEFRVWDEATSRPVRCKFKAREEKQAKDFLGKRVSVKGSIRSNRYGRPLAMIVHNLEDVPLPKLPPIEALMGTIPSFTGGLSMREYFEELD